MQIEQISEDEFFDGLNQRIADLAAEIENTAQNIEENPDSSTYHMDRFFYPLKVMRKLERIRDKARAFRENEDEPVVYVKKTVSGEKPKYYYLPQSEYDERQLGTVIEQLERMQAADDELGYIG